jgi:CHRD domain
VRKLAPLALAALATLVFAAYSIAAPSSMGWSAKLTAAQEVPKQVVKMPGAHGSFTAALHGKKLAWKLTFAGLSGPATAAHIHMAAMGKSGNVVVPLCTPCKSPVSGTATLTSAVINAFGKHLLYVNVHTKKNPAGEIRGQLGG